MLFEELELSTGRYSRGMHMEPLTGICRAVSKGPDLSKASTAQQRHTWLDCHKVRGIFASWRPWCWQVGTPSPSASGSMMTEMKGGPRE